MEIPANSPSFKFFAPALGLFLCTGFLTTQTAQAQTPSEQRTVYVICAALTDFKNVYYSSIFAGKAENSSAWGPAFWKFLNQRYNYKGSALCPSLYPTLAEATAALNHARDSARQTRFPDGTTQNFVQTGWTYPSTDAAPSAEPAPAAAVPPQPTVSTVVCSASDASRTAYVSATFQVTAMDNPGWINGFKQFLTQKYGYNGVAGCNVLHADTAQTFLKGRVTGLRSNGKTVVETGWTFNSAPTLNAAPPAAAAPAPARKQ
jgi:hypothetical protein